MPRTRPERTNPLPSIAEPVIDRFRRWTPTWYRWIEPLLKQTRETADRVEAVAENATAEIAAEAVVRASADSALGSQITTLTATVNSNASTATAQIQNEATVRASADSALSSQLSTVSTTVGANTSSINSLANSVNGVEAQWGVSVNVNNRITGAIRLDADLTTSTFAILANRFEVVHPTNNGLTQTVFVVGNINGVPTVGINGNVIVDGSVLARHIAANSITANEIQANAITSSKINADAVTANKIAAGSITADKINVSTLSAIVANLGTVTAGVVQSADGKSRWNLTTGEFVIGEP